MHSDEILQAPNLLLALCEWQVGRVFLTPLPTDYVHSKTVVHVLSVLIDNREQLRIDCELAETFSSLLRSIWVFDRLGRFENPIDIF